LVVSVRSRSPIPRRHLDQPLDLLAQQRLAAGQPDFAHAQAGEHACDARDFLEGQQLGMRQERIIVAEDIFRHAVDAAKITAIGDGDPQVVQRPSPCVGDRSGQRRRQRRVAHERGERIGAALRAGIGEGNDRGHISVCSNQSEMVADDGICRVRTPYVGGV
jgi:hypothetical protein